MSNKFLGTTGAEIDVTNGSTVLYGSTIGAKSLKPSYAVKTNSAGNLISTKLFISDVENLQQKLNSVITNPYAGDLESKSFVSNNIYDTTRTSNISLSNDTININSESVKINGETVITAGTNVVQNPMVEDLNCNTNNLTNIGLLNGYDIGTIDSDLTQVKDKTLNITLPITFDGTTFAGAVYADTLVKSGGTNQQYLMADGSSLQYSANSGNSNFYLYNNATDQDQTPPNGFITYNAPLQDNATFIYISHRTRDTIDIEVFFKNLSTLNDVYIQDQENSDNNITYNITGNPIIVSQAQVTIPVIKTTSNGTGSSNFGNGHNLLLSFFTNSIETDVRISNLETKTQNITANGTINTITKTSQFKLSNSQLFSITDDSGPFVSVRKFAVTNTKIDAEVPMSMNSYQLSGIPTPIDDDQCPNKLYVDNLITPLQAKVQNITGSLIGTDITNNLNVILRVANGDFFTIRNDATPFSQNKFGVSNTSVQISSIPLQMNNQKIQFLATPVDVGDATRKDYVDNLITPLQAKVQNITGFTEETQYNKNSTFILRNGVGDVVSIRDDQPSSNLQLVVSQSSATIFVPLFMETQRIRNMGDPVAATDATTKNYVDTNFIKMVSNTFTASWGTTGPPNNLITRTFTYKYIIDSTGIKIVTLGIPHIRTTITVGPLALFSSSTPTALPAIIRPATESISAIRIVVNNVFEFGYIVLSAAGLISFARISSSWANNNNGNGSGAGVLGDYMYITYVAA